MSLGLIPSTTYKRKNGRKRLLKHFLMFLALIKCLGYNTSRGLEEQVLGLSHDSSKLIISFISRSPKSRRWDSGLSEFV